jgi:hypothetical protein
MLEVRVCLRRVDYSVHDGVVLASSAVGQYTGAAKNAIPCSALGIKGGNPGGSLTAGGAETVRSSRIAGSPMAKST